MAAIHDNVFDAALNHIKNNADKVELRAAGSSVLVAVSSGINASDYGSPVNNSGSGGGRKINCLKSSAIASQAVSAGGSISKLVLIDAGSPDVDLVVASVSGSPVNVGSSDQVTISAFSVILKDPT